MTDISTEEIKIQVEILSRTLEEYKKEAEGKIVKSEETRNKKRSIKYVISE